jgi:tRNA G37 N-methylase Trm5
MKAATAAARNMQLNRVESVCGSAVALAARRRGDRIALDQLMRDDMVDDDACRARIRARLFVGGEEFAGRKPICCVAW